MKEGEDEKNTLRRQIDGWQLETDAERGLFAFDLFFIKEGKKLGSQLCSEYITFGYHT